MSDNTTIHDESPARKYFTQMLNMAEDDLDPFQYRLLAHYIRWSSDGQDYPESIRQTAVATKMSVNKVQSTLNELSQLGYLEVYHPTQQEARNGATITIKVVDRWLENINRYQRKDVSNKIQAVSEITQGCIKNDTPPVSNMIRLEEQKKEELKRDTRKSANLSKSKSQKPLPVNRKTWQWEHIERYALENPDIDELAMLDDQAMHPTLKQLPTKATALDCIELYEEMKRNGKGSSDYGNLWMKTTFRPEYSTFKCMLWHLPTWLKHPQHAPVKQTAQEKRAAMLEQLRRDSEGVVFELPLMRKPE